MARIPISRDLTASEVAQALGWPKADDFLRHLESYIARGFPSPDPLTGRFDPAAFERWRRLRNSRLFPELTPTPLARDAASVFAQRMQAQGG